MSFVYFLDVFDASGLPPTLPAKAAADQLRGQRMEAPNGKLVQLLARIHEKRALLEGATVNVVGGAGEEPVHWVDGATEATPIGDCARFTRPGFRSAGQTHRGATFQQLRDGLPESGE